ncbi:hypothetical protein IQ252_08295 [Tychonema sp. LEGE 07203]|nr:hypothetical protein [Tychonema sp. LEGE 07203]
MKAMQPKKSQTTQNQALWIELNDDAASQYSGGENGWIKHKGVWIRCYYDYDRGTCTC